MWETSTATNSWKPDQKAWLPLMIKYEIWIITAHSRLKVAQGKGSVNNHLET